MLTKTVIIVKNFEDYQKYNGEELIVIEEHRFNYFTVENNKGRIWLVNYDDIKEIKK